MSQEHLLWRHILNLWSLSTRRKLSLESYRDLPPGTLPFLTFPAELRNKIYPYFLEEKHLFERRDRPINPIKPYGWTVSHRFNFGLLRVNKQIYRELSGIVYDTIFLALTMSKAWGLEFSNLDLRLPGTTNIRVFEINISVDIPSLASTPLPDLTHGTEMAILGVIRQLDRMPNLEKVHVWHSGLVCSLDTKFYHRFSLDQEFMSFFSLKDYKNTTRYKEPYQGPVAEDHVLRLVEISTELHSNDSTRFGRAFTCHVKRP